MLVTFTAPAAAPVPEQTAKAAIVFHLLQFVTWPETVNAAPFRIGVLGTGSFEESLRDMVAGEKNGSRAIEVKREANIAALADCDLVFIEDTGREPLGRVLSALGSKPVLTVGETDGFVEAGGMIALRRTADRKLRLQVNLQSAQAAGFRISSQLLRVADVVKGGPR